MYDLSILVLLNVASFVFGGLFVLKLFFLPSVRLQMFGYFLVLVFMWGPMASGFVFVYPFLASLCAACKNRTSAWLAKRRRAKAQQRSFKVHPGPSLDPEGAEGADADKKDSGKGDVEAVDKPINKPVVDRSAGGSLCSQLASLC